MEAGQAVMLEGDSFLVTLEQTFSIPADSATLSFDLVLDPGFDLTDDFIPDAFEVTLLTDQGQPAVPTWDPLATSFFNMQEDGFTSLGSGTTWNGLTGSVDVSAVPPGTVVTLFFDFIGADADTAGGVRLDHVRGVEDCNNNGTADPVDLSSGASADCNLNEIPDECDIASGTSADVNANGIPDECECRCLDLAFVIDDTVSMGPAINRVKDDVVHILNAAVANAGADLRIGLITFKDTVTVLHPLTYDMDAVRTSIEAIAAAGGTGDPDASDEAIREMLSDTVCTSTGDFDTPFRNECRKVAILITDALPAGCDDVFTTGIDDTNAMLRADEAAALGIEISALFVPTQGIDPTIVAIMQYYASRTGGTYAEVSPDGAGVVEAILQIIRDCPCEPEGDFDHDGDVDVGDYALFADCLGGPEAPSAVDCLCEDLDTSNSVDLYDFAIFEQLLDVTNGAGGG